MAEIDFEFCNMSVATVWITQCNKISLCCIYLVSGLQMDHITKEHIINILVATLQILYFVPVKSSRVARL